MVNMETGEFTRLMVEPVIGRRTEMFQQRVSPVPIVERLNVDGHAKLCFVARVVYPIFASSLFSMPKKLSAGTLSWQ